MSDEVIWDGEVGPQGDRYHARVTRIGKNFFRGVLSIMNQDDDVVYQVEVPIAQNSPFKVDAGVAKEWSRVIDDWMMNKR